MPGFEPMNARGHGSPAAIDFSLMACWRRSGARLASCAILAIVATIAVVAAAPAAAAEDAAASAPTPSAGTAITQAADGGPVPLVLGHRTIHTFRAPLGAFTPADRAEGARLRIQRAFEAGGDGWMSVRAVEGGFAVEMDGKALFLVLPGDVPQLADGTAEQLANAASRAVHVAFKEARERRDPRLNLAAAARAAAAAAVLLGLLLVIWRGTRWVRDTVTQALAARVQAIPDAVLARRVSPIFLRVASRGCLLLAWLASLLAAYIFVAYTLDQFAHTRALGEGLYHAFTDLVMQGVTAVAAALPGVFVAALIFLVAWVGTQVSTQVFNHVASGRLKLGMLDAHTAPATRRIVNASLWLFALAMAYPYLPGAQTEAFKGLTVIVGLMVSIGASGLVGQIASGVILVYTRALLLGEYVRIQDCEGTVTEIGLFVTRVRTGLGSEYALPNSLVLGNVTRNFSRESAGPGHVLETTVTIGYDTPWRQVHALLLEAAAQVGDVAAQPAPYVVQTALSDFYVVYRLVVHVAVADPARRAQAASDLNAQIQDMFNRYGVQIMSPGYYEDPAQPKIVPESKWYAAPARRPDGG